MFSAIDEDIVLSSGTHPTVYLEEDAHKPSSYLLSCATAHLGILRHIRKRHPLVFSDTSNRKEFIYYLLSGLTTDAFPVERIEHTVPVERIAQDRWRLCSHARRIKTELKGAPLYFLSSKIGISDNPVETYFTNLFCSIFGVNIKYPLARASVQAAVWSSAFSTSYYHQAYDFLFSSGHCEEEYTSVREGLNTKVVSQNVASCAGEESFFCSSSHRIGPASISPLGNLWFTMKNHATSEREMIVALVTANYETLFMNFLCFISSQSIFQDDKKPILVLTSSSKISEISKNSGLAVYDPPNLHNLNHSSDNSFGSLTYQEMILVRTSTIMSILLLGFSPLIVDIDTVWHSNPLEAMKKEIRNDMHEDGSNIDLIATDDNGEICGCFIFMYPSNRALQFWWTVLNSHEKIVANGNANSRKLDDFSMSEQKILTELLVRGAYDQALNVFILSTEAFPSGYQYFNRQRRTSPVIVHNNFIIGIAPKIARFKAHNLWRVANSGYACTVGFDHLWRNLFDDLVIAPSIPSVSFVLPVHDTIINTDNLIVQISLEGFNEGLGAAKLYVTSDPPQFISFDNFFVGDVRLPYNCSVSSLVVDVSESDIVASVDIAVNRSYFSIDNVNGFDLEVRQAEIDHVIDQPQDYMIKNVNIKVITYKRWQSLRRLLHSLNVADYLNHSISLEIIVDGSKDPADDYDIGKTLKEAVSFEWEHGPKNVTQRLINLGLDGQWYSAWSPASDYEASFIFEDDMVVSPHFYRWTQKALGKYYTQKQYLRQKSLLGKIRALIARGEIEPSKDLFRDFSSEEPVFFGICLQRQHLDPLHFPKELEVKNGFRPFFFSLVGSWGPLFLPLLWQAFLEWHSFLSEVKNYSPFTESLITNHFYRENHKIWTPWMIRFAYETGTKCLYPNLPGNLSLVANYREAGENYDTTMGPNSVVLEDIHMNLSISNYSYSTTGRSISDVVWHLPSWEFLCNEQYDFNLRGTRAAGQRRSERENTHGPTEMLRLFLAESKNTLQALFPSSPDLYTHLHDLSVDHLASIQDMCSILPSAGNVGYVEPSILSFLFRRLHFLENYSHHVYSNSPVCFLDKFSEYSCSAAENFGEKTHHTMIVVDTALATFTNFPMKLISITSDFLLVISSPCFDGPYELSLASTTQMSPNFALVMDVCTEGSVDKGAKLYQNTALLPLTWKSNRVAIIRRLQNGLIQRKIVYH
jgi:hypothetical protein